MIKMSYSLQCQNLSYQRRRVEAINRWQQEKHQASLEKLVRSHARIAYSMAFRYSSNPEHVEDLACEA